MSTYGPPLGLFDGRDDDVDADNLDGISPWAHESQRRWKYYFWLERLSAREAILARKARKARLEHVPSECPICIGDTEAPTSEVRPRLRPEPEPPSEPQARRNPQKPTLRLV
jgi:hypothetical protein